MNILTVENLTKDFGTKPLFKNLGFGIQAGEKVALVARNGSGKTTLLKIITGGEIADSGKVTFRNNISVGYLNQEPVFDDNLTVIDALLHDNSPKGIALKNYEISLEKIENEPSEQNTEEMLHWVAEIEKLNAWEYEAQLKELLGKFEIHHLQQTCGTLSGGQKKRLALCRLILENHDFLILDEPTNHLDIEMIEWLENYLMNKVKTLFMVTHDRFFLDRVCNVIMELEPGKMYRHEGNYEYFVQKKQEREENEAIVIDKAKNLYKKELEWVRRMPKARTTKSKSRIDAFYDLKEIALTKKQDSQLVLDVKMNRLGGKVLELKKIYKSFDGKQLLKGFDYTFKTGERIGLVGKNGSGKSTLINIILNKIEADSGKVIVGETVVFGHFSQEGIELKENLRIIEVVKEIADVIEMSDKSKLTASQLLTLFQFPPAMQFQYVNSLSGGEKRRLQLLLVLMKNPNFLILDEPTNDLDLLTLSTLESFLDNYQGCLILVTHDRYFMDRLVDQLFIFEGNGELKGFVGKYYEYREAIKSLKEMPSLNNEEPKEQESPKAEPQKSNQKKASYKDKLAYEKLEKEIADLENEKLKLETQMTNEPENYSLYEKLGKIVSEIDLKTEAWMELAQLME
jgi:ATP-binding cassette subfamily F protein uup